MPDGIIKMSGLEIEADAPLTNKEQVLKAPSIDVSVLVNSIKEYNEIVQKGQDEP